MRWFPAGRSAPGSRRETLRYRPSDGSYSASPAPLWRRGVAATIDWTLAGVLYLLALIPAGLFQNIGEDIGGGGGAALYWAAQAAALSVLVVYFTYFYSSGHTMGMRALDIYIRDYESGRAPSRVRSFARTLITLLLATATLNAYSYVAGEPFLGEFSDLERRVGELAVALTCVGVLGHLWKLWDPEGRTVWDRLTGLIVVEDVVPARMPDRLWSPWGT